LSPPSTLTFEEANVLPQINRIVYATGLGTGAPYVFRYALSIARQYDAKIDVVCGLAPLSPQVQGVANIYLNQEESTEFHRQAQERVRTSVEQQVKAMCSSAVVDDPEGLQFVDSITVIADAPDKAVLQCVKDVKADIVVMGTHRRTMDAGASLGSCAVKVVHQSSVPVLLVRIPEGYKDLPTKSGAPPIVAF
jgi:nucleotide-binding universal stress UspA family protein